MNNHECMQIPNCGCCIKNGTKVKLGRFQPDYWIVGYGWYTWGGNRPFCGWYLTNEQTKKIKPLQLPDLDDIYVIEN